MDGLQAKPLVLARFHPQSIFRPGLSTLSQIVPDQAETPSHAWSSRSIWLEPWISLRWIAVDDRFWCPLQFCVRKHKALGQLPHNA